ncbi:protein obstructor-E-like [Daphnia pulicaria]|uniref:protein obstructor-E-like n=1 Tax=Daphnia pulicaria TaxID=35523 RepID=UPI001EEA6D8F|nr:protein obstructor-E-like [Daphnia pulicaria]
MKSTLVLLLALYGFLALFATAVTSSRLRADERDIDLGESDYQCPEGLYVAPHETQCELYYICASGGTPTHLYQCRDDLLFDLKYYGCNFKDQTECGDLLAPFTCPSPSGKFPIREGTCDSRYYVCTNDVAELQVCPNGGIFDAASSACVATACPTTTTPAVPTAPGLFECPAPSGNFPSPYSCSQYYVCVDGTALLFECAAGLYYNAPLDICDWPSNVNCILPTSSDKIL